MTQKVTKQTSTKVRKGDHIQINLEKDVSFPRLTTGLERYRFVHRAVPELSLDDISLATTLFGKQLNAPLLISSMTGGTDEALRINQNLAEAAQEHRVAMGLGSQRAALEDETIAYTFRIRDIAPHILLFSNVGAVQLNYGYGVNDLRRAVDMVEADALILHFNVLQEAVQPEGDTNFAGLLNKIETVCNALEVPVIAKEVGWGFSETDVKNLADAGVAAFDVAGSGGTSWSEVEYYRATSEFDRQVARAFADWGIPTAQAIETAREHAPQLPLIASGGLRDGIDIAKCIALGANIGGMAGPLLKAANVSAEAVSQLIEITNAQLRIAMFCTGAANIVDLKRSPLIQTRD